MSGTARLADDSGTTLLDFQDPALVLTTLDLGYPSVRASSTPASGQDGELDVTRYMGARPIVAETYVDASAWAVIDTIRGLMHPGRRYWLHVQMDGWSAERRIRLRPASFAFKQGPIPWTAQLGWQAPSPTLEDTTTSSVTLSPTATASGGFVFPLTFPATAPAGLVPGASIVQVMGTAASLPTVDIYGPCSAPLFQVLDTGQSMSFPGLTIAQGDYLHIDCAARTVTLNNDPAQSRYQALNFAISAWPSLPPGQTEVVFSAASTAPTTVAVVSWRNNYL